MLPIAPCIIRTPSGLIQEVRLLREYNHLGKQMDVRIMEGPESPVSKRGFSIDSIDSSGDEKRRRNGNKDILPLPPPLAKLADGNKEIDMISFQNSA